MLVFLFVCILDAHLTQRVVTPCVDLTVVGQRQNMMLACLDTDKLSFTTGWHRPWGIACLPSTRLAIAESAELRSAFSHYSSIGLEDHRKSARILNIDNLAARWVRLLIVYKLMAVRCAVSDSIDPHTPLNQVHTSRYFLLAIDRLLDHLRLVCCSLLCFCNLPRFKLLFPLSVGLSCIRL